MKLLITAALLALSFSALASSDNTVSPDAWVEARPHVKVTVSQGAAPDTYIVNAVVSDLRTGNVLAEPVLVTKAGSPARVEIGGTGAKGMMSVAFTVTVDSSGQTAAFTSEIRNNEEIVASQSAVLAVAK